MTVDARERRCCIVLEDGRRVTLGASIDVDCGAWFLHDTGLLRWLTASVCRARAAELNASADHLEAHPSRRKRR